MKRKGEEVRESPISAPVRAVKGRVPRLRFPEFRKAGEWEEKELASMCERVTQGGTPDTTIPEYWNGSICWLTPAEMNNQDDYYRSTTERTLSELGLSNCSSELLPVNSVILSTRAPIGHLVINKAKMAINQGCKGLVPKHNFYYLFIYYSLLVSKKSLIDLGAGNTFKELSGSSLRSFKLPITGIDEQRKIAACLSSLDELIAAHTKKLEALKAHKKGLMQKLFPAEGEGRPRLRFPEFRKAGEWEDIKLGAICEILMCKRIFAEQTNDNDGVPFYKIGTLGGKADSYLSEDIYYEYKKKYNFPRKGEVLITCSGTVGKCVIYNGEDAYYQDSNIVWIDNQAEIIDNSFLYYILVARDWKKLNSTTITRIYSPDLKGMRLVFPRDKAEQQKIAATLSSLDSLLAAQGRKLEALREHKRGLLQGLFPRAEEE